MKRVIAAIALACVLTSAWAQDFPAGMRREIVEIEQDDHEYSLFSYKDADGMFGYYLSLGRVTPIVEAEIFGGHTAEVDLTRSTLKSLRWNINLGKKLGLNE